MTELVATVLEVELNLLSCRASAIREGFTNFPKRFFINFLARAAMYRLEDRLFGRICWHL